MMFEQLEQKSELKKETIRWLSASPLEVLASFLENSHDYLWSIYVL